MNEQTEVITPDRLAQFKTLTIDPLQNNMDNITTTIDDRIAAKITYGTSALTDGTSALDTGVIYFQYE